MNLFTLFAKIGIDDKEFNNGVNKSESTFRKFGETTTKESMKMERQFQKLSQQLGGEVPQATQQAVARMYELNREFRNAKRSFGSYSSEARNAKNAITQFALGLDDTTFKQIYMRSQLGLTDTQLQQQANSIKLNARMTKLMGDQTQILTQRMEGLKRFGIKPEDLMPPSTPGVFKIMNETMEATGNKLNMLSAGYRKVGTAIEGVIKKYSVQKVAIREAQGDMVKYGLIMRGLSAGIMDLSMAIPIVGVVAGAMYAALFKGAFESNEKLKELSGTVKEDLSKAFEPLMQVTSAFLTKVLQMVDAFAKWKIELNQAHPILGKILGVIEFLAPALALLFTPLYLGVGLWKGWMLVLNDAWVMLGGISTAIGIGVSSFLTLAVVIGALTEGFFLLMQNNQKFHDTVMSLWSNLLAKGTEVFTQLKTVITDAFIVLGEAFEQGGFSQFLTRLGELFTQLGAYIISQIPIVIAYFGQLFTAIFTYWTENAPRFYEIGLQLITKIFEGINTNLPIIIDGITNTVIAIIDTFVAAFPKILDVGVQILIKLVEGINNTIPKLIDSAILLISKIVDTITQNLPKILDSGIKILNTLVDGIIKMLPQIIDAAIKIIIALVDTIVQNLPKIIEAGVKIMLKLIDGIIKNLPQIIQAMFTIMGKIVEAIIQNLPLILEAGGKIIIELAKGVGNLSGTAVQAMADIGVNMIKGLWGGIKSMGGWLKENIKSFLHDAVESGKAALGIHSPSRVMAKEIGRWMPPGISRGFADAMPSAIAEMESNLDNMVAKVSPTLKATGSVTGNQTQSAGMVNNFYGIDFRNVDLTARQIQDAQRRMEWELA